MMIMDRRDLNDYCTWLFDVLFEIYNKIDCSKYSTFERRYVGRISELLFNVWLENALESRKINKNEIMELDFDVEENKNFAFKKFVSEDSSVFKSKVFKKKVWE